MRRKDSVQVWNQWGLMPLRNELQILCPTITLGDPHENTYLHLIDTRAVVNGWFLLRNFAVVTDGACTYRNP